MGPIDAFLLQRRAGAIEPPSAAALIFSSLTEVRTNKHNLDNLRIWSTTQYKNGYVIKKKGWYE